MSKNNYYAVKNGNRIFTSWVECAKYIKGVDNVEYKGFKTLEECKKFLKPPNTLISKALKAMGNPSFSSSYETRLAVWLSLMAIGMLNYRILVLKMVVLILL